MLGPAGDSRLTAGGYSGSADLAQRDSWRFERQIFLPPKREGLGAAALHETAGIFAHHHAVAHFGDETDGGGRRNACQDRAQEGQHRAHAAQMLRHVAAEEGGVEPVRGVAVAAWGARLPLRRAAGRRGGPGSGSFGTPRGAGGFFAAPTGVIPIRTGACGSFGNIIVVRRAARCLLLGASRGRADGCHRHRDGAAAAPRPSGHRGAQHIGEIGADGHPSNTLPPGTRAIRAGHSWERIWNGFSAFQEAGRKFNGREVEAL